MVDETASALKAIADVAVSVAAIRQDMSGIDRSVMDLRQEVKRSINEIHQDIGVLQSELLATRTDIMSRMDRLQNKLPEVTDDISVNYASADQSGRIAKAAQEKARGLSEVVFAMQRQIRRIAAQVSGPGQAA